MTTKNLSFAHNKLKNCLQLPHKGLFTLFLYFCFLIFFCYILFMLHNKWRIYTYNIRCNLIESYILQAMSRRLRESNEQALCSPSGLSVPY